MAGHVVSVPEQQYADALEGVDGIEVIVWDGEGEHERACDVTVFVPPYLRWRPRDGYFERMPSLQVVQTLTAGYDNVISHVPDGVALCNGTGIHETSTAELAVALTLASLRGIPQFVRAQQAGQWLPVRFWESLADRDVLLVGYGSIGKAIAKRLVPFEVSLAAMGRTERDGDAVVRHVYAMEQLPDVVGEFDVVILIVPLTDDTRHLIDAAVLACMRPGALLVNVARGPVVDTDALVRACAEGRVRAALDVTDPEPLPADHPLWTTDGVLVSPHVGGASTAMAPRARRLLRRQVEALARGERPDNVVN